MNSQRTILLGSSALVVAAIALVLAIRAMIPRDELVLPSPPPRETEDAAVSPLTAPGAAPDVLTAAERDSGPVQPTVVAQPTLAPQTQQLVAVPLVPIVDDATVPLVNTQTPTPPQNPGTPEPIASIRQDFERFRDQLRNLRGDGGGGGLHQSMVTLVQGSGLVMRLAAGDSSFAEQMNHYRAALGDAGVLDPSARAALRARFFDPTHAERGALFDEVISASR